MAGLFDRIRSFMPAAPARSSASPFSEVGVSGTPVFGGVVGGAALGQRDGRVHLGNRYSEANKMLRDISIVAAGVRYFANLVARPTWKSEPPNDSAEAKAAAEFFDSVMAGTDTSWTRIIRRSTSFRFHGFGIQEWVAKKREDGKTGLKSIEPRPQHTIRRWDVDDNGGVLGVWQTAPGSGQEIYLPRPKLLYLVDDTLTDSPEGMGWFSHLVEPTARMRRYLELETIGFERDLSGIPVGRAPLQSIRAAVKAGTITEADGKSMIAELQNFVSLKAKMPNTGLVIDSQPFTGKTGDGTTVSTIQQWGMELLTGKANSMTDLGKTIDRVTFDMALIIGVESLLTGYQGTGSLALSKSKSNDLALNINSTLADMAESVERDIRDPVWALNGLPEELKPKVNVEDASFKDVEQVASVLSDMAAAGAILAPDDPIINDVRDLLGAPHQREMTPEELGILRGGTPPGDPNEVPPKGPKPGLQR